MLEFQFFLLLLLLKLERHSLTLPQVFENYYFQRLLKSHREAQAGWNRGVCGGLGVCLGAGTAEGLDPGPHVCR